MSTRRFEDAGVVVPPCECGATEGAFHDPGCRWELCPFCGANGAEGCECVYDHLGLRCRNNPPECDYLPKAIYEGGLGDDLREEWHARCASRGRLPYVYAPEHCARCGSGQPCLWFRTRPGSTTPAHFFEVPCCARHASRAYAQTSMRISLDPHGCPRLTRSTPMRLPGERGIRKRCVASIRARLRRARPEKLDTLEICAASSGGGERPKASCHDGRGRLLQRLVGRRQGCPSHTDNIDVL